MLMVKQIRAGDVLSAKGYVYKDRLGNASLLVDSLGLVARFSRAKTGAGFVGEAASARLMLLKAAVVCELRRLLVRRGYAEIETPVLHSVDLANTNVKPFVTRYGLCEKLLQLRISPEFWLKNYMSLSVCLGVFEFAKSFRNEGGSLMHLMEFSLLEAYCLDLSFEAGLKWTIQVVDYLGRLFLGRSVLYRLVSFCEVIREATGYRVEMSSFLGAR